MNHEHSNVSKSYNCLNCDRKVLSIARKDFDENGVNQRRKEALSVLKSFIDFWKSEGIPALPLDN